MQARFKAGMDEMEQAAADELEMTKTRALNKYLNMKLTTLNLSALLASVEISRKKMHNALSNYKTETLIEKRTQIKVLEKEIEKFASEKDALEETRVIIVFQMLLEESIQSHFLQVIHSFIHLYHTFKLITVLISFLSASLYFISVHLCSCSITSL